MGKRGPKPGSGGRPKKPLNEKLLSGNPGKRPITFIEFDNASVDLEGQEMPPPSEFLSAKQKDGSVLLAPDIYKRTWNWLNDRGCASIVSPQLLERFAMASARWIQCEMLTSQYGFLAKHPTTGAAIQSPYVAIGDRYMNQSNKIWNEIFQIVRDNCTSEYGSSSNPQDSIMERLLQIKGGG